MARIRTVKPEILEDERTAALSDAAFRLFLSLIFLADDYGNLRADSRWLAGQIWWSHKRAPDVDSLLGELEKAGLTATYEVRDQRYVTIVKWAKHQRIDNAGKARVPRPSEATPVPAEIRGEFPRNSAGPRPPTPTSDQEHDHATAEFAASRREHAAPAVPSRKSGRTKTKPSEAPTESEQQQAIGVMAKLAKESGIAYRCGAEHVRLIVARLRAGVLESELRMVIVYCATELGWASKPEMTPYLRPETLFGPKAIERYLDAARTWWAKQQPPARLQPKQTEPHEDLAAREPAWWGNTEGAA